MTKVQLNAEQSESGWWFVTSPDPKGLLVAAPTLTEALALVPKALTDLETVRSGLRIATPAVFRIHPDDLDGE